MKWKKSLSVLLSAVMSAGYAVPVLATENEDAENPGLSFEKTDQKPDLKSTEYDVQPAAEQDVNPEEVLRVSIVLDGKPVLEAGFSDQPSVAAVQGRSYQKNLARKQDALAKKIEKDVLKGGKLDVVWKLTLAANAISANVKQKDIAAIEKLAGVKEVVLERRYEADQSAEKDQAQSADPNMVISSDMTGGKLANAAGYKGESQRIAVIDTGTDTDHQSFDAQAFDHALEQAAADKNMDPEAYKASLDLLDPEEIKEKLPYLHAYERTPDFTAEQYYLNEKLAFGYNYIDKDLDITHDNDTEGEHGSHVAGISTANEYIPDGQGGYKNALEAVKVQGEAPNAQLLTFKVFGRGGGAYDSDYMAAIEDAIVLGCDSINLSLGSGNAGNSTYSYYQDVLDSLSSSQSAVVISAGNSGSWVENAGIGYLHSDDINLDMVGSPGSYTNAFTVASVDNDGFTGEYLQSNGKNIFYTQQAGQNRPISSLSGEYDYILIDSIGTDEEFAAVEDVLKDKIAVCYRGTTSFYEKANAAMAHGAAALLIANNQPGTINMSLDGYSYTNPCVALTQSDGLFLQESAQKKTTEGGVEYYQGKITIGTGVETDFYHQDEYVMSDFSSYGAPGSLEMKPEITAPGGNIYSVNGMVPGGTSYENMSGTSMAAPQITGLSALVNQKLEEPGNPMSAKESRRFLMQSLLMSTATPLTDKESGNYWPVLKQGAGLADVSAAISSDSYIAMHEDATDSWKDGKVKAELKDDPERKGVYSFGFDLNNPSGNDHSYTLSADLFTQDVFDYENEQYLDYWTSSLDAEVTYTVNGKTYTAVSKKEADVNKDGVTDTEDARSILEYLAGSNDGKELDLAAADVDGNGEVKAWDAHLILASLETEAFTVKAGTKAEVQVNITFPQALKDRLNASYENGAWIEGYTFINPQEDEEGSKDAAHSIPVLGFYGNFTDASMTDRTEYWETVYGKEDDSYLQEETNVLAVKNEEGGSSWYLANPYGVEAAYPADKASMRSDTLLDFYRITLIRNAKALAVTVSDENGKVRAVESVTEDADAAYYYSNGGYWADTTRDVPIGKTLKELGFKDGETAHIEVAAIPEALIEKGSEINEETVRSVLAEGHLSKKNMLSTTVKVDDQAPELVSVHKNLMDGSLKIAASDNNGVAAVAVTSPSGAKELGRALPQAQGNEAEVTVPVDPKTAGEKVLVVVADYAGNETSYLVDYKGDKEIVMGGMYGFTPTAFLGKANTWMEIEPETFHYSSLTDYSGLHPEDYSRQTVIAADYTDGYVFYADTACNLYSANQKELGQETHIASLKNYGIQTVRDMSWDEGTKSLYVLDGNNAVWNVSPLSGRAQRAFTISGTSGTSIVSFTADGHGNFFGAAYGGPSSACLYEWKYNPADYEADEVADVQAQKKPEVIGTYVYQPGALEWDESTQSLYLAAMYNTTGPDRDNSLWKIDPETGKGSLTNPEGDNAKSRFFYNVCALYIVQGSKNGTDYQPTTQISELVLDETSHEMYPKNSFKLTASVLPWTVENREVEWSSSDPEVAVVENGVVTSVKAGTCQITAVSVLDPSFSAVCELTVKEFPSIHLTGLVEKDGETCFADLNTADPAVQEKAASLPAGLHAAAFSNGFLYSEKDGYPVEIDPDTLKVRRTSPTYTGGWASAAQAVQIGDRFGGVATLNSFGSVYYYDPVTEKTQSFTLLGKGSANAAAIASYGELEYRGSMQPGFYMIDEAGDLYEMLLEDSSWADCEKVGSTGLNLSGALRYGQNSLALYYDEEEKVLILAANTEKTKGWYVIDPSTMDTAKIDDLHADQVRAIYSYTRPDDLLVRTEGNPGLLYPGFTWQIEARGIMCENEKDLVYTSNDEEIATVDENGLITAVGKGETFITVSTRELRKDGTPATATVEVSVQSQETISGAAEFRAFTSKENDGDWSSLHIDENGISQEVLTHSDILIKAGGGNYGRVIATKATGEYGDLLYLLDADADYTGTTSSVPSGTTVVDAAYAPRKDYTGFTTSTGETFEGKFFGNSVLLTADGSFRFVYDSGSGSGWSLNRDARPIAIAYAGETAISGKSHAAQTFYVLFENGDLFDCFLYPRSNTDTLGCDVYTYNLGNIGVTFDNNKTYSMTAASVEGNDHENLFIADSSRGKADLFHLEITDFNWNRNSSFEYGYIGTLPDAAGISALHTWNAPEQTTQVIDAGMLEKAIRPEVFEDADEVKAEPAAGSVQKVSASDPEKEEPEKEAVSVDRENHTVTLHVSAQDVPSGQIELRYDAAALTFESGSASVLAAWSDQSEGKDGLLKAAFADAAAQNGKVMDFVFRYNAEADSKGLDTVLKLSVTEDGRQTPEAGIQEVPVVIEKQSEKAKVLFRLYNPNGGEHHYTADAHEKEYLVSAGWKDEGKAWTAPASSDRPVYRLYNPNGGDHHYTVSEREKEYLVSVGWKAEGIGWYSADESGLPVYRVYNPNAKTGAHHFTLSEQEYNGLKKFGWNQEGVAWYALDDDADESLN